MQPFPGNMTPPRMRVGGRKSSAVAVKLLAGVQQLHAEVWVASCEDSASHIEIVDVLAKVGGGICGDPPSSFVASVDCVSQLYSV